MALSLWSLVSRRRWSRRASLLLLFPSAPQRLRWLRGDRDRERDQDREPLERERETVKWYRRRGEREPELDEEPELLSER